MKIGFMQGRLSPIYKNKIQSFPWKNWKNEIRIAKSNNFKKMEWTLDYPRLKDNPILKNTDKTINFLKKNFLEVDSVTCDFFMQKPFFKKNNNTKDIYHVLNKLQNTQIRKIIIPLVDNSSLEKINNINNIVKIFIEINNDTKKKFIFLFESDFSPSKLKKFIKFFPKKNFGINYDSGNSASLGYDVFKEFKSYAKYIKNIHLKDRLHKGKTIRFGKGKTDFKLLFKLIKKIKYNENLILQSARHKSLHLKELKINRNYIKKFL